jgi:hypothetical protein
MDGGKKSRFDTNRVNEVTKHITSLRMGEEFIGVCEMWKTVKTFNKCGISNALDGTEDDVLSITVVMMSVTVVMKIIGDSVSSTNFILHHHFLSKSFKCE